MNADIVASGTCGTNVNWTLDSEGTLTISGSGPMEAVHEDGYSYYSYDSHKEEIKRGVIEDGITTIDGGAFAEYNNLVSIHIPDSVTYIGNGAFEYCFSLSSINIPDSVTSIGDNAFAGCESLASIHIPDSVTSFGDKAFSDCTSLSSVTLPKSMTSISKNTFTNCGALKTLRIGYVTNIEDSAFDDTVPLETVYYPCGHDIEGIRESFPNSPAFVPYHVLTKTSGQAATCTETGYIDYWTCDGCHKIFSDEDGAHEIAEEDTAIAALGHDWGEWVTLIQPTEKTPGEEAHYCNREGCPEKETRAIPPRPDNYLPTTDSKFDWRRGSNDGMVVIIKNVSPKGDDSETFGKFLGVSVDGTALTRDTDYTAEPGSIKLTLSPDYLSTLAPGKHTLTVVAPSSSDTPATGESIWLVSVSLVLLLLAAGGAAYVLIRRRRNAHAAA